MTRAVAYRLPSDLVTQIREASTAAGLSATEYVRRAIVASLEAPSLLGQPMVPLHATGDVPRGTWVRPEPAECAHPFRDNVNRCSVCGEQR